MNLIRKGFILLVLLLAACLVGVLAYGGDTLFTHALQKYAPAAFKQPVRFDAAHLSVFSGNASIEEFHVGSSVDPLFDIGAAAVQVNTKALLDGRLHIDQVDMKNVRMHLIVRENGRLAIDPGPPPRAIMDANPMPPREKALPPPGKRDILQIVSEYWERRQFYSDYYDTLGSSPGVVGSDNESSTQVKHPGMPDFVLAAQQQQTATSGDGVFWLKSAEIAKFTWETIDRRKNVPILPPVDYFKISLKDLGTPANDAVTPTSLSAYGLLQDGGKIGFELGLSHDGSPSKAKLSLKKVTVDSLIAVAGTSFPFTIRGGKIDLSTQNVEFLPDSLSGTVRVVLRNAKLFPRPISPTVLGVDPKEFCRLLNLALVEQPIAFLIRLEGTPTEPDFSIENETALGKMLGGAVKAEAIRRAQGFVDGKVDELIDGKLDELINDKLGDKLDGILPSGLTEQLEGELKGKIDLNSLLGGKKKGD